MTTRRRVVTAGMVVGILLAGAGLLRAGEEMEAEEQEGEVIVITEGTNRNTVAVKKEDMTKAAQAALTNALAGAQVADLKIEKETAGELTFYAVLYHKDGKEVALIITANGQVLKPTVVNVGEQGVTNAAGTIVIREAEEEEAEQHEKK